MENLGSFLPLVVGLCFIILIPGYSKEINEEVKCVSDTVYIQTKVYVDTGNIYNEAIDHLKEYEGFRSNVYYDTDGSRTIGYGHHLNAGESFTYLSEERATDLLMKDLDRRIDYVNGQIDTLNPNQSLALGLFAFNLGTGNLDKAISRGLLTDINRITHYCHYKTVIDGQVITKRSTKLHERRRYELYIFNK